MKKIILLLMVVGLTSCNSQPPLSQSQSTPQQAEQPPLSQSQSTPQQAEQSPLSQSQSTPQQAEQSPKLAIRSKADATQLAHKELPILGTYKIQLSFEAEDAEAIISNKPRPTFPLTLAVLAGNPPPNTDVCNLPFSAVTKAIFNQCLQEEMNYFQVANTFGFEGEEIQRTGSDVTYAWKDGDKGIVTVLFKGDKLYTKSQNSLK